MDSSDRIDARELARSLSHTRMAGHIQHFASVSSTSTLALEAAQAGAQWGVWVADEQTAGRGRGSHRWHSAAGNGLYVSVLLSPRFAAGHLLLSLAAGLAAWESIRAVAGLTVDIRWPNDLVTRSSPARKLGGILVETAIKPGENGSLPALRHAVVGIGINVRQHAFPPDLATEATSLYVEGWSSARRQPLLEELLQHLDRHVQEMEAEGAGAYGAHLLAQLSEASTWVAGKRVQVAEAGGYTGVTAGLNREGFLLINSDDGVQRTVLSGGVRELG